MFDSLQVLDVEVGLDPELVQTSSGSSMAKEQQIVHS